MQRVFLSPPNWLGFEAGDGFLLTVALVLILLNRPTFRWRPVFLEKRRWLACLLFALPVGLRLALVSRHPVPVPSGADDFGYLLLADTLRHFRLANPAHALPEFFEQVFVLQRPTYSSMFNLGQGLMLAFGWLLFGQPWAGVLLSIGCLCALIYWMLLAWTTPGWALAGGLLGVMLYGPLSYWTNTYWGGAIAACAGCLVFGAIGRRNALLLGLGIAIHLLVRPFESVFLVLAAAIYWPWRWPKFVWAAAPIAVSLVLIGLQNKAVTQHWLTSPYQAYRTQYGIPASFTFQRNPIPQATLNAEKQADYDVEIATHGYAPESFSLYVQRLVKRVRFLRFFLFAPLYPALALGCWFRPKVGGIVLLFALGSNFYPYFYPHYVAGVACLLILLAVTGLQRLRRIGPALLCLCGLQFACWMYVFAKGTTGEPTWNFVNGPDPQGRATIAHKLSAEPGKQLVFVHYSSEHKFSEWVHNAADIDAASVIYVNDMDAVPDKQLRNLYPDRNVWLLEPDADPPTLRPFPQENTPFLNVP